jgi:hypothetical protein
MFSLFCIRLVVTVPIILHQAGGYCSHYFGSGMQNNGNSNRQPDAK